MNRHWLLKSEPSTYSIEDLRRDKSTWWEGVRNYQARNFMVKDMKVGDRVLFYHSSCEVPGVMGIAKVSSEAAPDKTAQIKKSPYFDPKATKENPIWFCVEVQFEKALSKPVTLSHIRNEPKLADMILLKKGTRLSVQPLSPEQYEAILQLAQNQI